MNAHEWFHAGKLKEAMAAQVEEVRDNPTDVGRRLFFAELLCFSGDLARADKQLDAAGHQDPKTAPLVMVFRQLVDGAGSREEFFLSGRLPQFLDKPEGAVRHLLEASIPIREGKPDEAEPILERADAERPKMAGVLNGRAFDDFRDLDDQTSCVFEVLTSTGNYLWIPFDRVDQIIFEEPDRPRDLLWRPARMVIRGGPDGMVFLPTLYPGAAREPDDLLRLGRLTDWRGGDGAPVRGVGLRTFLVGDDALSILDLKTLQFTPPGG